MIIDPQKTAISLTTAVAIIVSTIAIVGYLHTVRTDMLVGFATVDGSIKTLTQRMDDHISQPTAKPFSLK